MWTAPFDPLVGHSLSTYGQFCVRTRWLIPISNTHWFAGVTLSLLNQRICEVFGIFNGPCKSNKWKFQINSQLMSIFNKFRWTMFTRVYYSDPLKSYCWGLGSDNPHSTSDWWRQQRRIDHYYFLRLLLDPRLWMERVLWNCLCLIRSVCQ